MLNQKKSPNRAIAAAVKIIVSANIAATIVVASGCPSEDSPCVKKCKAEGPNIEKLEPGACKKLCIMQGKE